VTSDPTGAALLRAVCLDPDDVVARLVYADWLEQEAGDQERGEFVRVQIRLAELREHKHPRQGGPRGQTLPACRLCDEMEELESRERELLGSPVCRHCEWHAPLAHGGWEWDFRRGFVEAVACTLDAWERHGPAAVLAQPVRAVRLSDRGPTHIDREPGFGPWTWTLPLAAHSARPEYRRASLPQAIYDLCNGWYPTEQDALDALSRACVAWARRKAGLDAPCCHCDGAGIRGSGYGSFGVTSCPDCKGAGWVAAR